MNIPTFIKKYDLFRTFFINELSDIQISELKNCEEFSNVYKFNIIDHKDSFYWLNTIDFNPITLNSELELNSRINIIGFKVISFPTFDTLMLDAGFSQWKDDHHFGYIVYKFDYDEMRKKFISMQEAQTEVGRRVINYFIDNNGNYKNYNNNINNYHYNWYIYLILHKDSVKSNNGYPITIPLTEITNEMKLF